MIGPGSDKKPPTSVTKRAGGPPWLDSPGPACGQSLSDSWQLGGTHLHFLLLPTFRLLLCLLGASQPLADRVLDRGHGVDDQLVQHRVQHQVDAHDVRRQLVALLPLVRLLDERDLLLPILPVLLLGKA